VFTVIELAEAIKEKGRRSAQELPTLLQQAEQLAGDVRLNALSRALAHRAAANAHQLMNEFEPALVSYDRAIGILETIDEAEELGRTLHAKIGTLSFLGRYDELVICADRAREIFESLNDHHRLARLDTNLSHVYHRLNRFDMVLRLAERAMHALKQVGDDEGYMVALNNSAGALMLMNDFDEAERRFTEALALAQSRGWADAVADCRFSLAFLLYLRGSSAKALQELETLRSAYENAGDKRRVCHCFLNESEILTEIGDVEGAIDVATRAKALALDLGLSFEAGRALLFEAMASRRLKNDADTGALLSEATHCFQQLHNDVWAAIAKLQVALARDEVNDDQALSEAKSARSLLAGAGLPNRLALADIVIGRIQKSHGDIENSLKSFESALAEAGQGRSEWMQFHAAHELGQLLAHTAPTEAIQHLRTAEKKLDSLWDRLGSDDLKLAFLNDRESVYTPLVRLALQNSTESAFEFSDKARSRVLAESLGTKTTSGAALVGRLSSDQVIVEYFVEGSHLLIFTLTEAGVACHRQVGGALEVQSVLDNFERHIESCSMSWERLVAARRHQQLTAETHLRELYRILVEPVATRLRKQVIVVPHGLLHRVPFHALWNGNSYLVDSHDIAYSPSATLYCSAPAQNASDSALFVAFSGAQKTTAEDEVREAASKVPGAQCLVNPSIAELRDAFKTPHALVHIAGHAGIDSIGGRLSWIETAQGRLTHRELSELAISARTVVITGCQTARRTIRPGDEWQGLMRSFYMTGASAVVSALWDIRDQSAREFAAEFYNNFSGNNVLSAVQIAMKRIREQHDHPYFWAGFSTFVRAL
jgi:CHAT domain-containing protein